MAIKIDLHDINKEIPKQMSLQEFRDTGLLQEINRKFLHPMGLSMYFDVYDNGTIAFGGIYDAREDPEGLYYADNEPAFNKEKEESVSLMFNAKRVSRWNKLGYHVQQTPDSEE